MSGGVYLKLQSVPLVVTPSQNVPIVLSQQACVISVYQKTTGLFFDLTVNGVSVVSGRICRDFVSLVRSNNVGFIGNLFFIDSQGNSDPDYKGLGSRYTLVYASKEIYPL